MLQHLPDEPNNRTPPSCTALPRKLTDHFNTVTAMCFSSIYILEQTLSHYGIETRPPFAASPRAHMTPEEEARGQPPAGGHPAPPRAPSAPWTAIPHLAQAPTAPSAQGRSRAGDWAFGGLGQGTGHSGPSSNRCSSFARFVPEEQLEERALAARCSPTLDVLRSRS